MDDQAPLNFDRATYAPGVATGPRCASCQAEIRDQYWRLQEKLLCLACQGKIAAAIADARAKASFGKAVLVGGAVALACGIGYAIFVQVSGMQLALITIGIAYVIAKVVRKAAGGLGGRRFQILAMVLTYVASAMGYAGPVLHAMSDHLHDKDHGTITAKAPDSPPAAQASDEKKPVGGGAVLLALLVLFGIILAAPILAATQAPIGLVIIAIGLYEAWKLSRPVIIALDGPYNIASGAAPSS